MVKSFAGIGILPDNRWEKYEKYNIRSVAETPEDRERRFAKIAEVTARAELRKNIETTFDGKQIWTPNNGNILGDMKVTVVPPKENKEDDDDEEKEDNDKNDGSGSDKDDNEDTGIENNT